MRILLVEDNADIVRTLTELLRSEGYDVEATPSQNGAIALGTRVEKPFDLVLLDVTLEQGNGFAVCGALKEARPHLPVVFLTASDDEFNTVAGLSMGADDYIAKPFRPRDGRAACTHPHRAATLAAHAAPAAPGKRHRGPRPRPRDKRRTRA